MNPELLEQIGLSRSQAKAYLALLAGGHTTPPQLAARTGLTRTNAYDVLTRLADAGLAEASGNGPTLTYRATHPSNLEALVAGRRRQVSQHEAVLREALPELISRYHGHMPAAEKDDLPKLIRDRVPQIVEAKGERLDYRPAADDHEFLAFALKKLLEEATEASIASPAHLPAELGDLYEILEAVIDAAGLTEAEVRRAQSAKRDQNGSFNKRLILLNNDS